MKKKYIFKITLLSLLIILWPTHILANDYWDNPQLNALYQDAFVSKKTINPSSTTDGFASYNITPQYINILSHNGKSILDYFSNYPSWKFAWLLTLQKASACSSTTILENRDFFNDTGLDAWFNDIVIQSGEVDPSTFSTYPITRDNVNIISKQGKTILDYCYIYPISDASWKDIIISLGGKTQLELHGTPPDSFTDTAVQALYEEIILKWSKNISATDLTNQTWLKNSFDLANPTWAKNFFPNGMGIDMALGTKIFLGATGNINCLSTNQHKSLLDYAMIAPQLTANRTIPIRCNTSTWDTSTPYVTLPPTADQWVNFLTSIGFKSSANIIAAGDQFNDEALQSWYTTFILATSNAPATLTGTYANISLTNVNKISSQQKTILDYAFTTTYNSETWVSLFKSMGGKSSVELSTIIPKDTFNDTNLNHLFYDLFTTPNITLTDYSLSGSSINTLSTSAGKSILDYAIVAHATPTLLNQLKAAGAQISEAILATSDQFSDSALQAWYISQILTQNNTPVSLSGAYANITSTNVNSLSKTGHTILDYAAIASHNSNDWITLFKNLGGKFFWQLLMPNDTFNNQTLNDAFSGLYSKPTSIDLKDYPTIGGKSLNLLSMIQGKSILDYALTTSVSPTFINQLQSAGAQTSATILNQNDQFSDSASQTWYILQILAQSNAPATLTGAYTTITPANINRMSKIGKTLLDYALIAPYNSNTWAALFKELGGKQSSDIHLPSSFTNPQLQNILIDIVLGSLQPLTFYNVTPTEINLLSKLVKSILDYAITYNAPSSFISQLENAGAKKSADILATADNFFMDSGLNTWYIAEILQRIGSLPILSTLTDFNVTTTNVNTISIQGKTILDYADKLPTNSSAWVTLLKSIGGKFSSELAIPQDSFNDIPLQTIFTEMIINKKPFPSGGLSIYSLNQNNMNLISNQQKKTILDYALTAPNTQNEWLNELKKLGAKQSHTSSTVSTPSTTTSSSPQSSVSLVPIRRKSMKQISIKQLKQRRAFLH